MIKEIVKDEQILSQKSEKAEKSDLFIVKDLLDTAEFYKDRCCGLAAIQIGYLKRIIIVWCDSKFTAMINPIIVKKSTDKYTTEECCMSLEGKREVVRHKNVTVMFTNQYGKIEKRLCGMQLSQIVQHEIDHLNGKLI